MTNVIEQRRLERLLLTALIFVLGFQVMRFLFASLTWYLRDTLGIGVIDLVPISLAPFVLGALLPILSRFIPVKRAFWLGVALLVGSRFLIQLTGQPGLDYWAASVATLAFVGLTPFLLSLGREPFVGGILLGLAVDSAIKGLGFSLDIAFQPGWRAVIAVGAITLTVIWAGLQIDSLPKSGVGGPGSLRLLALAPYLFVQFLIFQNQGWLSAVIGVSGPLAMLIVSALNVLALVLAARVQANRWVLVLAASLVAGAVIAAEGSAVLFGILILLAVPVSGLVLGGIVPETDKSSLGASGSQLVIAMTFFLILGLAYYLPLDMNLGFSQAAVRITAAISLFGFGLTGATRVGRSNAVGANDWVLAGAAALLPLAALVATFSQDIETGPASEDVIRVMSYNIHSAFNIDGVLDIESIARVIEDSQADIVGLQEVPRGRLLSGTSDMLTLLRLRLGFEHVAYFGTTDPVWGNAILSRYPITDIGTDYLPKVGTPMRRGLLGATIQVGGTEILVISTHLQHVNNQDTHDDDPMADLYPVHLEQINTILEDWGGRSPAVLMGDFNARPDWDQIGLVTGSGWVDSWEEAGMGEGFTSSSGNPQFRIDYVFHTSDLVAVDVGVFQSTASDHLPVIVDIAFD